MHDEETLDYREAYEQEHLKCAELAGRVADLEAKNEELLWKLDRIRKNPLWKASKPFRSCVHWLIRQKDRLANCGGLRGVIHKLGYKKRERAAMRQFGTESFPTPEQAAVERAAQFPRMVKISILVPLWNNKREFQIEMLDSVMNQTYENWELCLADGSDEAHSYIGDICREYAEKAGGRIVYKHLEKNSGIAGNTNACLQMATGEYIGLLDQDDILHPSVLYEYVKAINEQGADYLYCDETTFKGGDINKMLTMHFKPDFAPDNLRANNYICHFSVFARELLDGSELFRPKFDGSQDHDMILRLTDNAKKIVHVPRLMYYWRSHSGSVASGIDAKPYAIEAAKGAVAEHLRKHGYEHFKIESTRAFETIFRIRYQIIGTPKISIVIANKDHLEDLQRCVTSIREKSTYDNYEIIIVENNSTTDEIKGYYSELLGYDYGEALNDFMSRAVKADMPKNADGTSDHGSTGADNASGSAVDSGAMHSEDNKITVVTYRGSFNYSAVNNLGVSYSTGDYILLLNNDTEVITVNWMEELLMYAQRQDVGAVGAKLYYGDRTIQHAGVVIGLGAHRTAGHTHYKQHRQNLGYMGRLCYAQNVTAVTGACLMVKKSLYTEVGGLDEDFAISLNDVDLCLKLREKGLLNVFTPFAELYHYESVSRGLDDRGEKAERYNRESGKFREKWKAVLEAGDPYYNPNFSLDRSDFSLKLQQ
ncbi:MAG: glycosyltransferase [Acetatifactor sp.]|nr:glycosyltransferase [Acetatifactor sp.]